MKHSIVIRTDASLQIGGGHVMRCLSLAGELRSKGSDVYFVCRKLRGDLISQIEQAGFPVLALPTPENNVSPDSKRILHESWLEIPWETDAQQTAQAIESSIGKANWLVVDHYGLDENWEKALRHRTDQLLVIDDLADRPHDCDILIDQTFTVNPAARYESLIDKNCRLLLGPKFALLRREFAERRKKLAPKNGALNRILVFFGTVDSSNQTGKALEAIRLLNQSNLKSDVVVGATNPHREKIRSECAAMTNAHFHCPAENMIDLLAQADLAIGAAGTTSWERCCLGLPAIVIQLAENQKLICDELHRANAITCLGDKKNISAEKLAEAIREFLDHPEKLRAMSEAAWKITDGLGARRASQILGPLQLRRATFEDAKLLWEWANDPNVRRNAFQSDAIAWSDHENWLRKRLHSPDSFIWIASSGGNPVGQIRFDVNDATSTVDISIASDQRGRSFGLELLTKGLLLFWKEKPAKISAFIKPDNRASQAIFIAAGFDAVPSSRSDALQFELTEAEFLR